MSDIFDLYQDLIIDHSRSSKYWGKLEDRTHFAHGKNPLCGDDIKLDLKIQDNIITNIAFDGEGCAIAKASASLMSEKIKNKSIAEVQTLFASFHAMLVSDNNETEALGKLNAFKGVRQFPVRVKCATLCWHTLNAALASNNNTVTTE
jgi:nitrogen fixation NifU-like protein